jgi:outer membrane protein assembly factor BamB
MMARAITLLLAGAMSMCGVSRAAAASEDPPEVERWSPTDLEWIGLPQSPASAPTLAWERELDAATILSSNGVLVAAGPAADAAETALTAVDPRTGADVWTTTVMAANPDELWDIEFTQQGDYLIVPTAARDVDVTGTTVLDVADGNEVWASEDEDIYGARAFGHMLVLRGAEGAIGIDLRTGEERWRYQRAGFEFAGARVILEYDALGVIEPSSGELVWADRQHQGWVQGTDGLLVTFPDSGRGQAVRVIDAADGTELVAATISDFEVAQFLGADDDAAVVLGNHEDAIALCSIDLSTGATRWMVDLPAEGDWAWSYRVDGEVYVLTWTETTFEVRSAPTGEIVASLDAQEDQVTLVGGHVYQREAGELAAFALPHLDEQWTIRDPEPGYIDAIVDDFVVVEGEDADPLTPITLRGYTES